MVYDPSARSRSASGVFPRGFPSTNTSASAGRRSDQQTTSCDGGIRRDGCTGAGAMVRVRQVRWTCPPKRCERRRGGGASGCPPQASGEAGVRERDRRSLHRRRLFCGPRVTSRSQQVSDSQRGEDSDDKQRRHDRSRAGWLKLDVSWRSEQRWRGRTIF